MIVSHEHFMWFVTVLIVVPACAWFVVDVIRLRRALRAGPEARDRIFGSVTGLIVAVIGFTGVLIYHLG